MILNDFDLLIDNSEKLNSIGGIFSSTNLLKCYALNLTFKNKVADTDRIKEAIKLIKQETSIFSNFRGNNLHLTAITLSIETNMKESFLQMKKIHEELKKEFFTNEYLVLATFVIYNSKDKIDFKTAVKNTRLAYNLMKKNHAFLTGSEDIVEAAMLATTKGNLDLTFDKIEASYKELNQNGFSKGQSLQSLSHMLIILEDFGLENKIPKIVNLKNAFSENKLSIKDYTLPFLAIASLSSKSENELAKETKKLSEDLKKIKGFNNFSLDYNIRELIALTLIIKEEIKDEKNINSILETVSSNIALIIEIAIQNAILIATIAVTIISSSSSGN